MEGEVEVVVTKRDIFVDSERIAKGTELIVRKGKNSEYYTIAKDCLPDSIKKKFHDGYPIVVHHSLVTKPKVIEAVNLDDLMSVLEVM